MTTVPAMGRTGMNALRQYIDTLRALQAPGQPLGPIMTDPAKLEAVAQFDRDLLRYLGARLRAVRHELRRPDAIVACDEALEIVDVYAARLEGDAALRLIVMTFIETEGLTDHVNARLRAADALPAV